MCVFVSICTRVAINAQVIFCFKINISIMTPVYFWFGRLCWGCHVWTWSVKYQRFHGWRNRPIAPFLLWYYISRCVYEPPASLECSQTGECFNLIVHSILKVVSMLRFTPMFHAVKQCLFILSKHLEWIISPNMTWKLILGNWYNSRSKFQDYVPKHALVHRIVCRVVKSDD